MLLRTTSGSIGDKCLELLRSQNQSCGQFSGHAGPVENSEHALAFECSLVLVLNARDVWQT